MTQHTQGPWTIGIHKVNSRLILSNGRAIAAVQCGELDSEANARLIAAAPELLAALLVAKKELEFLGYKENGVLMQEINAAIAKAKGE